MGEREMAMASFGLAWQAVRTDEGVVSPCGWIDQISERSTVDRSGLLVHVTGCCPQQGGQSARLRMCTNLVCLILSDLGRFLVGFCAPAPRKSLPEL